MGIRSVVCYPVRDRLKGDHHACGRIVLEMILMLQSPADPNRKLPMNQRTPSGNSIAERWVSLALSKRPTGPTVRLNELGVREYKIAFIADKRTILSCDTM